MSKTFVYDRFDFIPADPQGKEWEAFMLSDDAGEYILAEYAINREAVLQAQIRTLEVQLKDLQPRLTRLQKRSDWLSCLELAGVDNWQGMEEAIRIKEEDDC
jgi:hypothetical protein